MSIKKLYLDYLYGFICITLIWYIISIFIKSPILPSPIAVFINLFQIFNTKIAVHALYSLWRIFAAIIAALILGIPIGLSMGYFSKVDNLLSPIVYFTYPIPKIALLPIIMLILGLGEKSKIFIIVIILIFQIIIASRDAVHSIPDEFYYSLDSLGAGKFQIFKEVIFPATLKEILTTIRIALGTSISILFFTETFGTEYGMGYFIMDSWMRVNYIEMYSGILVLSFIGFLLFTAIDILEHFLCSWK